LFPPLLREHGAPANHINLEYEKEFSRVFFVAAKKYAGWYANFKGKTPGPGDKPKVRGLEMKRGDAGKLARTLQEQVVTMITKGGCSDPAALLAVVLQH